MSNRRRAAALKYDGGSSAPVVTANGIGVIADNIIKKAQEEDIPLVVNKELTDLLCNVDIGDSIPSEVYEAVAHIIAYVTDLDRIAERWEVFNGFICNIRFTSCIKCW